MLLMTVLIAATCTTGGAPTAVTGSSTTQRESSVHQMVPPTTLYPSAPPRILVDPPCNDVGDCEVGFVLGNGDFYRISCTPALESRISVHIVAKGWLGVSKVTVKELTGVDSEIMVAVNKRGGGHCSRRYGSSWVLAYGPRRLDDQEAFFSALCEVGEIFTEDRFSISGRGYVEDCSAPITYPTKTVQELDLPEREGDPEYTIAVVHEFEGVTFVSSDGTTVTTGGEIQKVGPIPRWIDTDTIEMGGRLDSDTSELVHVSISGEIESLGPLGDQYLPYLVNGEGVGLYQVGDGWRVGNPDELHPTDLLRQNFRPLAATPDDRFLLGRWFDLITVDSHGGIAKYRLPLRIEVDKADFGPDGVLALGTRDQRILIVDGDSVVEVDEFSRYEADDLRFGGLAWDRTGTALVARVSGEPPDEGIWLICDLIEGDGCHELDVPYQRKDTPVVQPFYLSGPLQTLGAPVGFEVTMREANRVSLDWEAVPGAAMYILDLGFEEWLRTEETSIEIELEVGGTYRLSVVAVDGDGNRSPPSSSITLVAEEAE